MTDREKMGAVGLIAFFIVLCTLLFFTVQRPTGEGRSIQNNVLIEQRMKNRNSN